MKQQDLCTCLALTTLFAYKLWYSLTLCNSFSFFCFFLFFFLIYFSPLFCFLKTTLSFCYTLPLSQVQVHNASQTRRATLDRQDTRKEEMGLTRWCKLYLRCWCRGLATGGVGMFGFGVSASSLMVRWLRKLSCKTRDTSHKTQTSTEVSQRKRVRILLKWPDTPVGARRSLQSAGHSGANTPDTPVLGCSRQFVFLAEIRALDLKFVGIWLELSKGNAN